MNILILHHYALPPWASGGTRHYLLAKALVERGHSVTIIASRYHYATGAAHSDEPESLTDGVRFVWIDAGGRPASRIKRAMAMVDFARAAAARGQAMIDDGDVFDVVLGTSPSPFSAFWASRLARSNRLPFALEIRDLWPLSLRDVAGWQWWHPGWIIFRQLELAIYKSADILFTLLPNAHAWYTSSGVAADKIVVIPNGVDASGTPSPAPLPAEDPFVVVYAGSHGPANALETLVEAASLLDKMQNPRPIELRLIGDGATKPALMKLAEKLDVQCVKFIDPVAKDQVPVELAKAHACILHLLKMPTFEFGISPNKLFDYMLAARPVLYCVEAANDPVGDANAGLTVPPQDPQALANAIIELSQRDKEDLTAMGRRGRDYVLQNHEWSALAERFEDGIARLAR